MSYAGWATRVRVPVGLSLHGCTFNVHVGDINNVNNHYAVDPRYGLSLNDSIQMFDEPIQIEPFDHEIPEFNLLSEMARTSV